MKGHLGFGSHFGGKGSETQVLDHILKEDTKLHNRRERTQIAPIAGFGPTW